MTERKSKYSDDYIKKQVSSIPYWWHQVTVAPGIVTSGHENTQLKKEWMGLPENMTGKRVLDIGAYDGFFTFECEQRGADVTALDVIGPDECGFGVLHELFDSKARHIKQSVYNLHPEEMGQFDIVLFLGVLYHLRHPLLALDRIFSVCKDLLILESQICDDCFIGSDGNALLLNSLSPELEKLPLAQFYPYAELNQDPSNWWSPNLVALEKMIETSGFEPTLIFTNGVRAVFHCKKKKRAAWVEDDVKTLAYGVLPDVMETTHSEQPEKKDINMDLCSLIYPENPYAGFEHTAYPFDLEGWNSNFPNFETMIDQIQPCLIIEVGSWKGASAIHMARLLQQKNIPGQLLCIDTWLGSSESWVAEGGAKLLQHGYPAVFYQFLANVKHCGLQEMITPFAQPSLTAARWLQERQISADLIYIDASHVQEDVYNDLTHYWSLVKSGGAVFGDDYDLISVQRGVHQFSLDFGVEVEPRGKQWVIYKDAPARAQQLSVTVSEALAPEQSSLSSAPGQSRPDPGSPDPLIKTFLARPKHPQPLLSVIIPSYNTAPFLNRCLESVLEQTYPNLEIIVCDDASTDESPEIIREYEARYPNRVKGLFLEENQGVALARNHAVTHAQGEYLTFLDSDDYYYENRKLEYELALVMAYREEKGKEVIAYSNVVDVDEAGRYLSRQQPEHLKQGNIFEDVLTLVCLPRDFVIRRDNFVNSGGYQPWRVYEDWDMRIRLAARYEFYTTGINGTAWRQRKDSLRTGRYFSALHRLWPVFCQNLEKFVEDEQKKEDLSYRFDLTLNEIRNGGGAGSEIRVLRVACAERLKLINELHQVAQERLEIIENLQARRNPVSFFLKKGIKYLLPQRFRRFLKKLLGKQ